ncbi:MAG: protein NO VEIN domain-containing protein [Nitrososphaerales archaeon]
MGSRRIYEIPEQNYYPLKFPRSRFIGEVREILYYLSLNLVTIGTQRKAKFDKLFDDVIREIIKGEDSDQKTIDNIRTEMTTLFGLVTHESDRVSPSKRIDLLAKTGDTVQFFRSFCYFFQWPGGFNKEHVIASHLEKKIKFKPAKMILQMLVDKGIDILQRHLTAAETASFLFNDLRVTALGQKSHDCWSRILSFRKSGLGLTPTGDEVRYARDFLHFMVAANLLVESQKKFRVKRPESRAVDFIVKTPEFFEGYFKCISASGSIDLSCIRKTNEEWIEYFSNNKDFSELRTVPEDIIDYDKDEVSIQFADVTDELGDVNMSAPTVKGKRRTRIATRSVKRRPERYDQLGAIGEEIVFNFERKTLIEAGRKDLSAMVEDLTDNESLGYDIKSYTPLGAEKYIEVKTTETLGGKTKFIWSANEVRTAKDIGESYSIYRVAIDRQKNVKIYEIRNPSQLYAEGKISLDVKDYWAYCSMPRDLEGSKE